MAVSFTDRLWDSVQETFDGIGSFLPNLIGALLIFFIGRFIAKFIFRLVARVLKQANFDDLVDRSGLGEPLERAGFPDSGVFLAKIIYWIAMFIVIQLTVETLGLDALQTLIDDLVGWLPRLFVALIIVFVTGAVANFVRGLVSGATQEQAWGNAATTVAFAGVWFIGGIAALDQVQIASDIVDTLFRIVLQALAGILVIKFGIGGIWAARDRFWPGVYDRLGTAVENTAD
ncbi:MAG: hypothetical protein AAF567_14030 [Actinomycetota bacterium]